MVKFFNDEEVDMLRDVKKKLTGWTIIVMKHLTVNNNMNNVQDDVMIIGCCQSKMLGYVI